MEQRDRFVREAERKLITGLGRVTWWRLEREGLVPRRRKLSANAVGWLESELLQWVHERAVGKAPRPCGAP